MRVWTDMSLFRSAAGAYLADPPISSWSKSISLLVTMTVCLPDPAVSSFFLSRLERLQNSTRLLRWCSVRSNSNFVYGLATSLMSITTGLLPSLPKIVRSTCSILCVELGGFLGMGGSCQHRLEKEAGLTSRLYDSEQTFFPCELSSFFDGCLIPLHLSPVVS